MLHTLQAGVLAALEQKKGADPAPSDDLVVPVRIAPYGGELLLPERLLNIMPALYVELDRGGLERVGNSDSFDGDHTVDLIGCARNQVNSEMMMHEGARLLAWAMWALQGATIQVGDEEVQVQRFQYERFAMDANAKAWTGILRLYFESITFNG